MEPYYDQLNIEPEGDTPKTNRRRLTALLVLATMVLLTQALFLMPPKDFPEGELVHLKKGWTVTEVADYLYEKQVIRSPIIFKVLVRITGMESRLVAGYYVMNNRPSTFEVFQRVVRGEYHLVPIKITFPEGVTVIEVSQLLRQNIPDFDQAGFLRAAKDREGYLFPDTYFFLPDTTPEEIVETMNGNLVRQLKPLEKKIIDSGYSLNEILTMASILEEEARTTESRRLISGILWKRIETGMRLQVDAVFPYIMGKNTYELTKADLRYDSPYNTYRYEGLPPGPISNPGLDSIVSALSPESSPYWYYLSDLRGNMHYAANFDQHKKNKVLYIP